MFLSQYSAEALTVNDRTFTISKRSLQVTTYTQQVRQLTLIGPGEVKVDLADFDLKLRENLLSNLILKKIPIPAKTSSESFWTSDMTSKNDVLTVILMIFRQKSGRGTTLPTPPSVSQHSNQFPVAGRVECRGWRVRSRAYSLALSSGPLHLKERENRPDCQPAIPCTLCSPRPEIDWNVDWRKGGSAG